MAFKQFLQNLIERVGLAKLPAPPQAVDVPLTDLQQLQPILARLRGWGVQRLRLIAGDQTQYDDLVPAVRQAIHHDLQLSVRGQASDLAKGRRLADLSAAGAREIEFPFLSAIGEVHDALAGAGDYRSALRAMDTLASLKLPLAAQIVLTPSTRKTIERTLQLLEDRRIQDVRFFIIACRDDEPSSWALSACELPAAIQLIERSASSQIEFSWYPPRQFDPSQTLAQQVRSGPRAMIDALRIELDGCVLLPTGPAASLGNLLQTDWKSIARNEAFRAWKRRRENRCDECPGLAACEKGCLRDAANWSED
jgi:radical SAM protein with 4Fe4S-binding SPASM domain